MAEPLRAQPLRRRVFLQMCGTTAAGAVIIGCGGDDDDSAGRTVTSPENADVTLDFSQVAGVLNYAYALEQLEAAFYTRARETAAKPTETEYGRVIDALKGHEIAHREFFKQVLGDDAVGALEVNFSEIDFNDQDNVLEVASTFENLGVGAYNGAAKYLARMGQDAAVPLMAAGDIVSVEARHASVINDLAGKSFAPQRVRRRHGARGGARRGGAIPEDDRRRHERIGALAMSNDNILSTVDADIAEQIATRRGALHRFGLAAAAVSVPVAFAATARAAFAQDGGAMPKQVVDVLNFALTLERLENSYYEQALEADNLIPDDARSIFETIQGHEAEHVEFLEEQLGDDAGEAPQLDFTAGGMFTPFEDYDQFLLLSQAFEDTGQRAYRGQAPNLAGSPDVLTAALTIHSVEARHAARVRRLRELTGWIPQSQPDVPAAVKAVYEGMGQTEKYDVNVPQVSTVNAKQVTEAFDEPLTKDEVRAIVKPFVKS